MFVVERQEFALFLARSFFLGAVLGAVYLLLGFFRVAFRSAFSGFTRLLFLSVPDLAFSGVAAFSTILAVYLSNRGQVRISALLLELLGFCAVYIPFYASVEKVQRAILCFFQKNILLPTFRWVKGIVCGICNVLRERMISLYLKKYTRNIDRTIIKTVKDALDEGEKSIFPRG